MRRTSLAASIGLALALAGSSTAVIADSFGSPLFAFPGLGTTGFPGKANNGLFPPSTLAAPQGGPKTSFPGNGLKLAFPGQGQGFSTTDIGNRPIWIMAP